MPHAIGFQVRPPGEPKGPCEDEMCHLLTCMSARTLAETKCEVCLEPIGYGRQMLMRPGVDGILVRHRVCDFSERT